MKIVCLSDTHGLQDRMTHPIPDGDILLHAGDLTRRGHVEDLPELNDFLAGLPHRHKIFVPGNHDWCFEQEPDRSRAAVPAATCLIDESIEVEGISIWGSPWQPEFHDWAFNLPRGEPLRKIWQSIPEKCDVVVTHGPPGDILDRCSDGRHEGCRDLAVRIEQVKPRLHLFGHIHEAYGMIQKESTTYVNASICNLAYRPANAPFVLEWDEDSFL